MNHWQLRRAVESLKSGGVIAYPTESVFGLGCDPSNLTAIDRILSIKNRSYKKGLIILVNDIQQALPLLAPLQPEQIEKINQKLERATTWLIEKNDKVSSVLSGEHQKLAVRVTSNPTAKKLCGMFGKPIVSTSCNLNTKPASPRLAEIRNQFHLKVDQIIAGSCCGQPPSQIIDLESDVVLRR